MISLRSPQSLTLTIGIPLLLIVIGISTGCGDSARLHETSADEASQSTAGDALDTTLQSSVTEATLPRRLEHDYPDGTKHEYAVTEIRWLPPRPASCDSFTTEQIVPFYAITSTSVLRSGDFIDGVKIVPHAIMDANSLFSINAKIQPVQSGLAKPCTSSSDCTSYGPEYRCSYTGGITSQKFCVTPTDLLPVYTARKEASIKEEVDNGTKIDPATKQKKSQLISIVFDSTAVMQKSDFGICTSNKSCYKSFLETNFNGMAQDVLKNTNTKINIVSTRMPSTIVLTCPGTDSINANCTKSDVTGAIKEALGGPLTKRLEAVTADFGADNDVNNIYVGIQKAIETSLSRYENRNDEKFLFVITAGPNNYFDDEINYTKILEQLKKLKVKTFILHIDKFWKTGEQPGTTKHATQNPSYDNYWAKNKAAECTSDAKCQPYESCRALVINDQSVNTKKQIPADPTQKYCRPDYSKGGYTGPVDEFANIACQTEGAYYYYNSATESDKFYSDAPAILDGLFSFRTNLTALEQLPTKKKAYYKLSGLFGLSMLNNTKTVTLNTTAQSTYVPKPVDTRSLVYVLGK